MGVESVYELWSGRSGEDGIERKRDYTRCFEVRTTVNTDDGTVAGGSQARAMGLPGNGAAYPTDVYARLIKIRPSQNDVDPTLWTVSCDYSTTLPGGSKGGTTQSQEAHDLDPETGETKPKPDSGTRAENPLDRPAAYKWSHEKHTQPATHTWDGIPILNCADEPYDPPIEAKRSLGVLTVTKNYSFINMEWLDRFVDAVNISRFYGRAKRTWFMDGIDADSQVSNGVSYYQVVFRMLYNRLTHDHTLMERGWREKKNVAGIWTRVSIAVPTDTAGRASDHVPLLDGRRDSGFTYADDYVMSSLGKTVDGARGSKTDGSNPVISGVSYVSLIGTDASLNDGTKGRGQALGAQLAPFYSRWRVQPEKEFRLLGIGI